MHQLLVSVFIAVAYCPLAFSIDHRIVQVTLQHKFIEYITDRSQPENSGKQFTIGNLDYIQLLTVNLKTKEPRIITIEVKGKPETDGVDKAIPNAVYLRPDDLENTLESLDNNILLEAYSIAKAKFIGLNLPGTEKCNCFASSLTVFDIYDTNKSGTCFGTFLGVAFAGYEDGNLKDSDIKLSEDDLVQEILWGSDTEPIVLTSSYKRA